MGSQLRFDPSFFGLALRASAEADALLFSAHKDLSITRCPTRAGLRLTSTAKASGEWRSSHIKKPRDACLASDDAESGHGEGTREARGSTYPIARQCVFVRHACRVEDLPSRSRKGDHCSAGRWFLEQRS